MVYSDRIFHHVFRAADHTNVHRIKRDLYGGMAMEDQLWNLFRETGDPMGYLLYKAEKNCRQEKKPAKAAPKPPTETPPASA